MLEGNTYGGMPFPDGVVLHRMLAVITEYELIETMYI